MNHDDREQHQVILSNNKRGNHNAFVALVPLITVWGGFAFILLLLGMGIFAATDLKGFLPFMSWLFKGTLYAIGATIILLLLAKVVAFCDRRAAHRINMAEQAARVDFEQAIAEAIRTGTFDGSNVKVSPDGGVELVRFVGTGRVMIDGAPEAAPQLALPATTIPTFAQLLTNRQITPYEDASILGYTNGKPRTGEWAQLHSFMALGISGSGKSSTVAYYVALAVLHGARLLIIDPDAEEDDSLVQRLSALSFAFLCPPAVDAKSASRVLDIAEQELGKQKD